MKLMSFRVPAELHRKVKIKAARLDVTVSQVVRRILREWVSGEWEWDPWDQERGDP